MGLPNPTSPTCLRRPVNATAATAPPHRFAPDADLDLILPSKHWPQPHTSTHSANASDTKSSDSPQHASGGGRHGGLCVPALDLADPPSISRFAAALLGPTTGSGGRGGLVQENEKEQHQAEGAAPGNGGGNGGGGAGGGGGEGVWRLPLHILINNAGSSLLPPGPRSGITAWGVNGLAQVRACMWGRGV